jgi:hypothetical protein
VGTFWKGEFAGKDYLEVILSEISGSKSTLMAMNMSPWRLVS